jgi:deoxyribonuclease-4
MHDLIIGTHVSMCAPHYLVGSVNEALNYGANCLMVYTGAPHNTIRTDINKLQISQFHQILKQHQIPLSSVIVHAPYIINIGANDHKRFNHTISVLNDELARTNAIGARYFILHPGNAVDSSIEQAINNVAKGINELNKINHEIVICLETMSGKGKEIGKDFNQLAAIIKLVNNKHLIGVCLDTCHVHDAGYDISKIDEILKQFDEIVGLNYLKVIHLNDSKNKQGASKDRHENIGYGKIGFSNLVK